MLEQHSHPKPNSLPSFPEHTPGAQRLIHSIPHGADTGSLEEVLISTWVISASPPWDLCPLLKGVAEEREHVLGRAEEDEPAQDRHTQSLTQGLLTSGCSGG